MFDSVRCMGETIEMSQPPMGPDEIGFRIQGSTSSSSSMIDTLAQHFEIGLLTGSKEVHKSRKPCGFARVSVASYQEWSGTG